jgi:hypothetical protein
MVVAILRNQICEDFVSVAHGATLAGDLIFRAGVRNDTEVITLLPDGVQVLYIKFLFRKK